ncbi:trypsin-5-like [Chrysoperla carnea]|uniref:trypsin-5-like n=1 Tax=Chrysoperla carnea TaxID=189513 RepID=UPI001D090751|nr:trypsin-5-like [Chrysoperla carnea]
MKLQLFICVLILIVTSTFGDEYFKPIDLFYPLMNFQHVTGAASIPFIAEIRRTLNEADPCIGSIIAPQFVITTASCFDGDRGLGFNRNLIIVEVDSVNYNVSEIHAHKRYERLSNNLTKFDIAVVQLKEPLTYSEKVKPIELPSRIEHLDEPEWGNLTLFSQETVASVIPQYIISPIKMSIRLPVMSVEKCQKVVSSSVTRQMICAGLTDSELGMFPDAYGTPDNVKGAPLVAVGKLQGIFNTGGSGKAFVFTRISDVREFIRWTTRGI